MQTAKRHKGRLRWDFQKKTKLETNSRINLAQLSINDDKFSTADRIEEKADTGTWFWNESANKTNSDLEEEGGEDIEEENNLGWQN